MYNEFFKVVTEVIKDYNSKGDCGPSDIYYHIEENIPLIKELKYYHKKSYLIDITVIYIFCSYHFDYMQQYREEVERFIARFLNYSDEIKFDILNILKNTKHICLVEEEIDVLIFVLLAVMKNKMLFEMELINYKNIHLNTDRDVVNFMTKLKYYDYLYVNMLYLELESSKQLTLKGSNDDQMFQRILRDYEENKEHILNYFSNDVILFKITFYIDMDLNKSIRQRIINTYLNSDFHGRFRIINQLKIIDDVRVKMFIAGLMVLKLK